MNPQISFFDHDGPIPTMKWLVASGAAATIQPGTPVKFSAAGAVVPMADANGTTSERFVGIAKGPSTDTATAAGEVYTYVPIPGLMYAAKAKSATAANTQAKIDALLGARLVFDLTAAVWTIDTAAGDGANNCVTIIGGEYQSNTLYFMYSPRGVFFQA